MGNETFYWDGLRVFVEGAIARFGVLNFLNQCLEWYFFTIICTQWGKH